MADFDAQSDDFAIGQDDAWNFVRSSRSDVRPEFAAPLLKYVDHVAWPKLLGEIVRQDPGLGLIHYTAAYPTEVADVPTIVYTLVSRTPGLGGVEPYKKRPRFEYRSEDGNLVRVNAQWMTCIYQFDCCAMTAQEADGIALELESLIRANIWQFQDLGVKDILFQEQLTDYLLPKDEKKIVTRSLRFMVQLEFVEIEPYPAIREIQLRVLSPRTEFLDTLVRGESLFVGETLTQTYLADILFVSDPHRDGIGRVRDYLPGTDFVVGYDRKTHLSTLVWLEAGKRPDPGATYYVRYLHFTAFSTLFVP